MKPGQTVHYTSYGQPRTGIIKRIGPRSGILFLENGQFLFPQSATLVQPQPKSPKRN